MPCPYQRAAAERAQLDADNRPGMEAHIAEEMAAGRMDATDAAIMRRGFREWLDEQVQYHFATYTLWDDPGPDRDAAW